jgi:hypothetical protein
MRDADEQRDVDFVSPDDVSPAVWSMQVVEKSDSKPTSIIKVLGAHLENGDASSLPRELVFGAVRDVVGIEEGVVSGC